VTWGVLFLKARSLAIHIHSGTPPRVRLFLILFIAVGNAAIAWKVFQELTPGNNQAGLTRLAFTLGPGQYEIQLPDVFKIVERSGKQVAISIPGRRSPPVLMFFLHKDPQALNSATCMSMSQEPLICYSEKILANGNGQQNRRISGYAFWDLRTPKLYFTIDDFAELHQPDPSLLLQFLRFLDREPVRDKN
jgi:hypothetical protein